MLRWGEMGRSLRWAARIECAWSWVTFSDVVPADLRTEIYCQKKNIILLNQSTLPSLGGKAWRRRPYGGWFEKRTNLSGRHYCMERELLALVLTNGIFRLMVPTPWSCSECSVWKHSDECRWVRLKMSEWRRLWLCSDVLSFAFLSDSRGHGCCRGVVSPLT